jgi:hypothetical protein
MGKTSSVVVFLGRLPLILNLVAVIIGIVMIWSAEVSVKYWERGVHLLVWHAVFAGVLGLAHSDMSVASQRAVRLGTDDLDIGASLGVIHGCSRVGVPTRSLLLIPCGYDLARSTLEPDWIRRTCYVDGRLRAHQCPVDTHVAVATEAVLLTQYVSSSAHEDQALAFTYSLARWLARDDNVTLVVFTSVGDLCDLLNECSHSRFID